MKAGGLNLRPTGYYRSSKLAHNVFSKSIMFIGEYVLSTLEPINVIG